MKVVIANILEKRKTEVTLVTPSEAQEIRLTDAIKNEEIEKLIVDELKKRHDIFQTSNTMK